MKKDPIRCLARALDRMSPLLRDVTAALFSGDDRWSDDGLAEHHGTTTGAVWIERREARRFLQETLESDAARIR